MTTILIPMAGEGKRFADEGYTIHKPAIPTIYRGSGEKLPMVVCAALDLPEIESEGENVIFVDRIFHRTGKVEEEIKRYFPKSKFITTEKLTDGQACTCLLAEDYINKEEPLLIAGCDNGMEFDNDKFIELTKECDVLVFTYRNNESVNENPNAYGWVKVDNANEITSLSIKKAISRTPMKDHAIVATFWFKKGSIFIDAAKKMIEEDDRINNEFYVDEVIEHTMQLGYKAKVFEINRYLGWGTPKDYQEYMKAIEYWKEFVDTEVFLTGE